MIDLFAVHPTRFQGADLVRNKFPDAQHQLDLLADSLTGMLYRYQRFPDDSARFLYVSQGARSTFGLSPDALYENSQRMFDMIHPDDLDTVRDVIARTTAVPDDLSVDFRILTADRGERWIRGHAKAQRQPDGSFIWHGYNQDITDFKHQALRLQETEPLLHRLMNDMPIGLALVDGGGRFYFRNRRFQEYFNISKDQALTLEQWWQLRYPDPDYRAEVIADWSIAIADAADNDGEITRKDYRVTLPDGSERIMAIGGLVFGDHFMATFEDRTEQQQHSERLHQLAYIDGLTGVPNRRRFDEALQTEWRRCQRGGKPLSVLMVDIDHFKAYNDHYGHLAGDESLQAVAAALHAAANRGQDLVARYGGEEFVCLFPECDAAGALHKAELLLQAIRALQIPHAKSPAQPVLTASIGVATSVPALDTSADRLLARADANLYRAKQGGRNRAVADD